jgi:phage terminase large subunit GpA-like protein
VGVTVAKTAIYSRLVMLPGGPRTIHFPQRQREDGSTETFGFDEQYFKQLTAEKMRTRYSHGMPYKIFEKDNNSVRNEAIDIRVYSLSALHSLMPIRWHKVKETFDDYEREHAQENAAKNADVPASREMGADGKLAAADVQAVEAKTPTPPPHRPFVPRNPARRGGFVKGW